ncbi:MAG: hypothetical protein LBU85_00400 [Treponema sp.]|nr:hypothetical protein [Treponema sp.]
MVKQQIILFVFALFIITGSLCSQELTLSGLLDSSVSLCAGAGDSPAFSCGVEEYASLRMQAKLRELAAVFCDVNFIAAAGDPAYNVIELERLYFRINTEAVRLDGGLLRLPFGYGLVWRPTDFLNPVNPLLPDARLRGVLGAGLSWYVTDTLKLAGFGTAPRDDAPWGVQGEGWHTGLLFEQRWDQIDMQAIYFFESPQTGSNHGIHRAGVSIKADLELGFVLDALYSYNHEAACLRRQGTGIDGLSLSVGFDYSLFDGNLIVIAEYLYNGSSSSTSRNSGGSFANEHYLYTGFTWRFDDLTTAGIALVSSFSDISFTPIVSFNRELFQGATLILSAQIPLDRDLFFGDGNRGELGPMLSRRYFDSGVKLRLRF